MPPSLSAPIIPSPPAIGQAGPQPHPAHVSACIIAPKGTPPVLAGDSASCVTPAERPRMPRIPSALAAILLSSLFLGACAGDRDGRSPEPPPVPSPVQLGSIDAASDLAGGTESGVDDSGLASVASATEASTLSFETVMAVASRVPSATPTAPGLDLVATIEAERAATEAAAGSSLAALAAPPAGAQAPGSGDPSISEFRLPALSHTWQKWNNCGPSSMVMALSAFGTQIDQLVAAAALKPDREDTNVSPSELAAYARGLGFSARVAVGGNRDRVRALLRAGVPVLAEQWIDVDGRGEMGHYRVISGYDDAAGVVIHQDSYYGANQRLSYDALEREWRPFLGAYVIVWLPEQRDRVAAAMGSDWDEAAMWRRALAEAEAWAAASPGEAWAQFALGEARSQQQDHAGAVAAFDRAVAIGLPFRAFWYQFGYYSSLFETGAFDRIIALADQTLAPMKGENLEESQYWKGRALRGLGREEEARASFERALEFNPLYGPAREALAGGG